MYHQRCALICGPSYYFYRCFIPHFSNIAGLLNDLTIASASTAFTWAPKHEGAFSKLKKALVSPPLLDYPLKNDQFVLSTDTSDSDLGAVLSTARGTVIEYASRTKNMPQQRRSVWQLFGLFTNFATISLVLTFC